MFLRAFRFQLQRIGGNRLGISIALALLLPVGCLHPDGREPQARIYLDDSPSSVERYCAWYGDARGAVLYFGTAAFWSAMRSHGSDPMADLLAEGPVAIGRFDLRRERMLEPLEVGAGGERSGVWDVLAHPNGRIYFTTFYESAGYTELPGGRVVRLPDLGTGLNELAAGPDGGVLASRYGSAREPEGSGSIVSFDADGALLAEFPLRAPDGYRVAPKTVAFDPLRAEIWVTTDLLPLAPGNPQRHDAYVLSDRGEELRRISEPEIQFVAFAENGTGYRAEIEGHKLWLRISAAGEDIEGGRRILLDPAFAAALDFVQDIKLATDGRVVVSRWSGWVHVVDSPRRVRSTRLPQFDEGGLYYSAVADGDRICATYCSDVGVVCRDIP
ncbi:MAG: hypothetical protein JRE43_04190 [Deltaproteobacteria bacterium]|jgi:hypothetical protein|nr:hypothetical protein [Deltaproteobacteria bacterium]MBW2543582.1 hypothetical protein [Deltaproteobacteria bacterium]